MEPPQPLRELDAMVLGVGRSGTTLLASMMQACDDIFVLPETQVLRRLFVNRCREMRTLAGALKAWNDDANVQKYGVPISAMFKPFIEGQYPYSATNIYRRYVACMAPADARFVVEKNPIAIDYLPLLRELFPEIRVVHIRRAPHDVVLSRMGAGWSGERSPLLHIVAYYSQLRAADLDRLTHPESHFELTYEKLVTDTLQTCGEVTNYLGAGDAKTMLRYNDVSQPAVTSSASWHRNIGKEISGTSVGRGVSELPPKFSALISSIELRENRPSTVAALAAAEMHRFVRRSQTIVCQNVLT